MCLRRRELQLSNDHNRGTHNLHDLSADYYDHRSSNDDYHN